MSGSSLTLGDVGEREIVRTIVPRFCALAGDDCACLDLSSSKIVVTTDPVPEPAAKLLGNDPDPYWMGWLLVTINASDLAAAGATPIGFVAAVEAPPSLLVSDFERLFQGIADACRLEDMTFAGGNLREGTTLGAVGTAVGKTDRPCLRRSGAKTGDILVSIGTGGLFWRDVLTIKQGGYLSDKNSSPLFRPRSQSRAMRALFTENAVAAAIDNSDGLLPSADQLASINGLQANIDLEKLVVYGAEKLGVDPARLWLGWGDWNVVAAVHPGTYQRAAELCKQSGFSFIRIGEMGEGTTSVRVTRNGKTQIAPRLESERFAKDSWFKTGVQSYLDLLLTVPLP